MIRTRTTLAAVATLLSTGVGADDRDDGDNDGPRTQVAVGAKVSAEQSPYVDGDVGFEILPQLLVQWGPVYLRGPSLGVYVHAGDDCNASTGIALDLRDTDRGDSPQLADMADLDKPLLGEFRVSCQTDGGELDVSFAADISGKHDGYMAGFSFGYPLGTGDWEIEPEAGIEWRSAQINRYYFGVSAGDALATRPRYEPDSGMSFELGATATYEFAKGHLLQLEAAAEWLPAEVSDSPIVDRDRLVAVGAAYILRF